MRILDLSRVLAGPFATMVLAELGAEVVKVEPPWGDETRLYTPIVDGVSTYFYSINRGKRSIAIDMKNERGREILDRLVRWADVLIHNYRDGVAERLGLGYDRVREVNPRIVYCVIRGYSPGTSLAKKPAYDLIIQAYSGIMMATGREGEEPTRVGFAIADIFTGLYAAITILDALRRNRRPTKIEVSLMDSMIYSMSYLVYSALHAGIEPGRHGSGHPSIVPYRAYPTKDGRWIAVAAANDNLFERLCRALGLEHLLEDPRCRHNPDRVENREYVDREIGERISRLSLEEILEKLSDAGVPAAPVNKVVEMVRSGYLEEAGALGRDLEGRTYVKPPMRIDGERIYTQLSPPRLSQHYREILAMLGYDDEEVDMLVECGAVIPSPDS